MKHLLSIKLKLTPFFLILLLLLLPSSGCQKPTEPVITDPPHVTANTMKIEYLWADFERITLGLKKSRLDSSNTFTYELQRKDEYGANQIIYKGRLHNDTTITDSGGLSQEKSYRYWFLGYTDSAKILDTAVTLTAKVLSPTGHSFVWEVDTLGEPGNAGIKDLWGLDENNVWGIGGVLLPEGSTGFMKWDGVKWNRIPGIPELIKNGIFGFSPKEIWVVGNGNYNWGGAFFWNGTSFTEYKFDADKPEYADTIYALNAVWGSAPDDVWAVGLEGTIIHWDGFHWEKVQSPTKLNILDIWGISADRIWAVARNSLNTSLILFYDGISWSIYPDENRILAAGLGSIFITKSGKGYAVGNLAFTFYHEQLIEFQHNQSRYSKRVRGTQENNIFICGQRGRLYHYDGSTWHRYFEFEEDSFFNEFNAIFATDTHVFVAGIRNKTIILRGKRK